MKIQYKVTKSLSIRQWFRENYMNLTYNDLQKHLRMKDITLNSKKTSPQTLLTPNDIIYVWDKIPKYTLCFDDKYKTLESKLILFENEDLIIINKPYGISTQGNKEDSLFLQTKNYMFHKNKHVYTIHRLDKNTTGVLIFALNRDTAMKYSNSIKTWKKEYIAVTNTNNLDEGIVETFEEGKKLITKYKKLHQAENYSIMKFTPITGKKHQIRKHAAHLKSPIIGDEKYNPDYFNNYNLQSKDKINKYRNSQNNKNNKQKMQLHCSKIELDSHKVSSPLPDHMKYIEQYITS